MFVSLAGPTSPAYSWRHGVRTEPGCFADRSFSTQAYKPRVLTDITCLRVAVPKTSFFCCLHLSSIRVSRSFPHRLADVRISVSTSFVRCYGVARGVPEDGSGRGLPSTAFRPLDPTLIAQCFPPIGRRPVACSAIDLRLALREGRPISRARLLFYPAIRVDSPTSPAVACSVRRQLSSEVTGARAHRSPLLPLAVLSYGWSTCPCFFTSFSHLYHAESGLFTEFASRGLQRPQTTILLSSSWRLYGVLPSFRHFERDVCAESHPLTFAVPYAVLADKSRIQSIESSRAFPAPSTTLRPSRPVQVILVTAEALRFVERCRGRRSATAPPPNPAPPYAVLADVRSSASALSVWRVPDAAAWTDGRRCLCSWTSRRPPPPRRSLAYSPSSPAARGSVAT